MRADNLTLLTDLYELTMMQGYFEKQSANETVIFDVFFRENPVKNGYCHHVPVWNRSSNTSKI